MKNGFLKMLDNNIDLSIPEPKPAAINPRG
jgi:hypothetical protein